MKSCILVLVLFCSGVCSAYSQCTAAPVAAAACSGGNGAASSGTNINSGNTYWFSGGASTFAGINLNSGGVFRVCGTLTLSSMNYNGGTLIVESGGKLTIDATMNLSGVTIINRGTLTINGSITLQGSNNTIYNDLSTSVLTITGTLTLNGTTSFVINRGIITAGTLVIQGTTGAVCMQDNAILNLTTLQNNYTGSIAYSGAGAVACVNVSTSAVLNNDVASSAKIAVCTGATSTGGAASDASKGWGLATVTNGCGSCATVLAAENLRLSARMGNGGVQLEWTLTGEPATGDRFIIERSVDGALFSTLGSQGAIAGRDVYTDVDPVITSGRQFYRIGVVNAATGLVRYSSIVEVNTGYNEAFWVYPNPAARGAVIHLLFSSPATGLAGLMLMDMTGRVTLSSRIAVSQGSNSLSWEPGALAEGIYFVGIVTPGGGALHGRLVIRAGIP